MSKGIYNTGFGGISFYTKSGDNTTPAWGADYNDILRIESDAGQMWQNQNFDINGNKVETSY